MCELDPGLRWLCVMVHALSIERSRWVAGAQREEYIECLKILPTTLARLLCFV